MRTSKRTCGPSGRPLWQTPPIGRLNDEEKVLAGSLVGELQRITALVGRDGDPCAPEGSLASRVATHLARLSPESRGAIVDAADRSVEAAAGRGPASPNSDGLQTTVPAGSRLLETDPAITRKLGAALGRRLQAARTDMRAGILRAITERSPFHREALDPATVVDLKIAGEIDTSWRRKIHMGFPELLDFRWSTRQPGAARAYWELRGPVLPGHPGNVVAGGYIPDIPDDDGVGGYFTIAMSNHLPPTPPNVAQTYHLRVLPLGGSGVGFDYGLDTSGGIGQLGTYSPTAPDGIGPWSPACIIRYGLNFQGTPTEFDIEQIDVYRKAEYFFDFFRLVEDQAGPGNEEFHLSGFVVEHTPQGAVQHGRIGPSSFTVDPDDRSEHPFGKRATVWLGTPNQTYWPRTLTAVVSMMEEDSGDWLVEWQQAVDELLHDMLHHAFAADVNAFLTEMQQEIADAQAELAAELAAETAAYISALIAATARDVVSAFIAAVAAWIMAFIRTGAGDDFYGTQVFTLALANNDAARIADGTAGEIVTSRIVASGGSFTGAEQPDGSFRMDRTELQFLGLGSGEEGSPVSGIANVAMHWEFKDKVSVYV